MSDNGWWDNVFDEFSYYEYFIGPDPEAANDPYLNELFETALFDDFASREEREEAYQALVDYLWDEYEVNFEEIFDWEEYREWYETTHG